eukprot:5653353-Pyramimonas_sp.AAC.1
MAEQQAPELGEAAPLRSGGFKGNATELHRLHHQSWAARPFLLPVGSVVLRLGDHYSVVRAHRRSLLPGHHRQVHLRRDALNVRTNRKRGGSIYSACEPNTRGEA